MKFGINIPNYGAFSDPKVLVQLARETEDAGWDGIFLWDHIHWGEFVTPTADPWIALAAMAAETKRIVLGPMVTPLPRRRPWKVAREAVTLDHLSDGRFILGVGLGGWEKHEFAMLGEASDAKIRGEQLDEALDIITGLWRGEPFSYQGKHYHIDNIQFLPTPMQTPRIPIWVAGTWSKKRAAFRRAARFDGVFPMAERMDYISTDQVRDMVAYIKQYRTTDAPFDVVIWHATTGTDANADTERIRAYTDAGVTWWQEDCSLWRWSLKESRDRIRLGPPHI